MNRLSYLVVPVALLTQLLFSQVEDAVSDTMIVLSISDAEAIFPVSKPNGDNSRIHYVIRGHKNLYFADQDFNLVNSIDIEPGRKTKIIASHDSRFFLTEEVLNYPKTKESPVGEKIFSLVDYEGHKYYSRSVPVIWDEVYLPSRVVSGIDGYVFELESYHSTLYVWDNVGNIIQRYKLFEKSTYKAGYIAASYNGSHIVVLKNERSSQWPNINGSPSLFLFDASGEPVWNKTLDYSDARGLFIVSDYIFCVVSYFAEDRIKEKTIIFDYWGNNVHEINRFPYYISGDGSNIIFAYIGDGNRSLISQYDINGFIKQWDYIIEEYRPIITGIRSRSKTSKAISVVHNIGYMDKAKGITGVHVKERFGLAEPKYWLKIISSQGEEISRRELGSYPPVFYADETNRNVSLSSNGNTMRKIRFQED